ncbi:MAG: hypothetical protein JAY63_01535 [Candidatus Thiodiazotropha taylori]|nr:hypothetical protein [Candidatus Thiodiazotropha taylori]
MASAVGQADGNREWTPITANIPQIKDLANATIAAMAGIHPSVVSESISDSAPVSVNHRVYSRLNQIINPTVFYVLVSEWVCWAKPSFLGWF